MPIFPTASDLHVNRAMTQISLNWALDQSVFIAGKVFPNVASDKQSDFYYVFPKGQAFQERMVERADLTRTPLISLGVPSTEPFYARVYSVGIPVSDRQRANSDNVFSLDRAATLRLTNNALLHREKKWFDTFFKSGVWTLETTGVASSPGSDETLKWTDAASDPIADLRRVRAEMHLASAGQRPNTLIVGPAVHDALLAHPDFIDRMKYGGTPNAPAMVTRAAVAALLEIDNYLVAEAIEDTQPDSPTNNPSLHYLAGPHAALFYVPPNAGLEQISAGYTFTWSGYTGATQLGHRIMQWRDDTIRADIFEVEQAYDMRVISQDCGAFFADIV